MIEYTLVRSRRKTVAIYITKDAAVEVRAPMKMPKTDINKFIAEKEKWIEKALARRGQLNIEKNKFTLNYGDTITLCGKTYPIVAKDGNRVGFDGECFYMPPNLKPVIIKSAVIQIYKIEATRIITEKIMEYAKCMNVAPTAIRITTATTRWGSCSGRNSINFSWRLVMADDDVINYVVVHELAHIREHNHSERFWAIVGEILPDYKDRQKKLKILQEKLSHEDWN
jgi:predicted metal-dependent hydrolase